jgi:hypothetical protein
MDEETKEFLDNLENQYGGEITWKTFATWYGCSDSTLREYGVFIFKINDTFYFEDFEKKYAIFGMELKTKKKQKEKYVKLQRDFAASEVEKVFKVSQSHALEVINKTKEPKDLPELNLFDKIFKKSVTAVLLKSGKCHFFEFLNLEDFKKNI